MPLPLGYLFEILLTRQPRELGEAQRNEDATRCPGYDTHRLFNDDARVAPPAITSRPDRFAGLPRLRRSSRTLDRGRVDAADGVPCRQCAEVSWRCSTLPGRSSPLTVRTAGARLVDGQRVDGVNRCLLAWTRRLRRVGSVRQRRCARAAPSERHLGDARA